MIEKIKTYIKETSLQKLRLIFLLPVLGIVLLNLVAEQIFPYLYYRFSPWVLFTSFVFFLSIFLNGVLVILRPEILFLKNLEASRHRGLLMACSGVFFLIILFAGLIISVIEK